MTGVQACALPIYLIETLTTLYAHADDLAPIEVSDRARVRLACTNAIQGAIEVADFAYKAAGVDAIFPGSPFERRFRDMHTLSQQIQARAAHFESVGQVLLGVPPEFFPKSERGGSRRASKAKRARRLTQ